MTGTSRPLGHPVREFATYESELRPDGSLNDIGHFTDGGVSWRGSIYFESASDTFLRLNDLVGLFEFDNDPQGNGRAVLYE